MRLVISYNLHNIIIFVEIFNHKVLPHAAMKWAISLRF